MSLAAIFAEARRQLGRRALPSEAFDDLVRVLDANRAPLLQFLLEAALEAGHDTERALARVAGLYFNLGALQVADDLADGDCDYLEPAIGAGSASQYLLQNLFVTTMIETGVSPATLADACLRLARAGAPQHFEIRTKGWTLERARQLAVGFGGEYMAANLSLIWAETGLFERASELGPGLGIATHVATEVGASDPRFTTLTREERLELCAWALAGLEPVRRSGLCCIARVLPPIQAALESKENCGVR